MTRTWIRLALAASLCTPLAAQVRPFGAGCVSHLTRVPTMVSDGPLITNKAFHIEIDVAAANAPFLLVFGISSATWRGAQLPLELAPFGFKGCYLNVSYDKVFGLRSGANGRLKLPIAAGTLPAGARLYSQILVPDPSGSRIAMSQGYEITMQASQTAFNVGVIPDTQSYVTYAPWALTFDAMTQWLVTNRKTKNLAFLSHVGDIVNDGAAGLNSNKAQWDRAQSAMLRLDGNLTTNPDGLVPYSAALGNRDFDRIHTKLGVTQWNAYFGSARYTGRKWYGGAGPDGRSTYQIFTANGQKYLHMMLEWRPRDVAIRWAQGLMESHPTLPAILTTHQYLGYGAAVYDNNGDTTTGAGDNGGSQVREKLVEPYPQLFLVLCGHNPGGTHRRDQTALGQPVMEMLMDYSFDPNGGNGWFNMLEFQMDNARLVSSCTSPTYKPGTSIGLNRSSATQNNSTYPFDFHLHRRVLETTTALRFTGGSDHGHGKYHGSLDTFIDSASAKAAFGTRTEISVADPVGSAQTQGLIKFGAVLGNGSGQVPPNKHIERAILTVTTEGAGATSRTVSNLYQLRVPFTESSTWDGLGGGVTVGRDTDPVPIATTNNRVGTPGTRSFDVTASLRAWQRGAPNHGWAITNLGTDSWSFRSREWSEPVERPMLTIVYSK